MSSTLTNLTAATTWSGTDLFYAVVGGNSRKIAASSLWTCDAANVISDVNGTTAQTVRLYRTFTDSSNYERLALQSGSGYFQVKGETAGTGTDNISLLLTTSGAGQVVIGESATTSSNYFFTAPVNLLVNAISSNTGAGAFVRWTADAFGVDFSFGKSRGAAIDSFTVVQNGDVLGSLFFHGTDGTNFALGAYITAIVDGTPGNNDMPTKIQILTSADGTESPVARVTVRANGAVQIQETLGPPAGGNAAQFIQLGSTSGFGIYYGSGAPSVSASQGSIYIRNDGSSTSTRLYINTTSGTNWTNVTTAT